MRTSVFAVSLLALSASAAHAQELKKGNVVGMHVSTIKLAAGCHDGELHRLLRGEGHSRVRETWPGWKFTRSGESGGEKAEGFGLIIVIPTEAERDKYYNADGSPSDLGKAANAKIQPMMDEMSKLGTITADPYIDWLVY